MLRVPWSGLLWILLALNGRRWIICIIGAEMIGSINNLRTLVVSNEFIVGFHEYFRSAQLEEVLSQSLRGLPDCRWEVTQRPVHRKNVTTDFLVVRITSHQSAAVEHLSKNIHIKYVAKQRKLFMPSSGQDLRAPSTVLSNASENILSSRRLLRFLPNQITSVLNAEFLWKKGYTGKGVRVALFDSGISTYHPHINNIVEKTYWTDEGTTDDGHGHGTFVSGLFGGSSPDCPGFAPEAELYVAKVFTDKQVSFTSWFLDAFNYALAKKVHIINISYGGIDILDKAFMDKVTELSKNNILIISAVGNDGPLYGTLNNPADQADVIGVGGITMDDRMASFSARGMTTWELPNGYGRLKPDLVTYSESISGASLEGGCRHLSGTSVASPVVAGVASLLLSYLIATKRDSNPAMIKQVLMESADRLSEPNMFEQGAGKCSLVKAFKYLETFEPHISFSPPRLDLSDCPYFWPYCTQPLYYTSIPVVINITIINSVSAQGRVNSAPRWHPYIDQKGDLVEVTFAYMEVMWPWSGCFSVHVTVNQHGADFDGLARGHITLSVETNGVTVEASLPVTIRIVPTPSRQKRLLWDQYHSIQYPSVLVLRDDFKLPQPVDWNGDHIHTNFKDLYSALRESGFYIEVLGGPLTCFDAKMYGALLLFDSELSFTDEERDKLKADVELLGLSLLVFADWYNEDMLMSMDFFDETTRLHRRADMAGANLPALNRLLEPWGMAFSDEVFDGDLVMGPKTLFYAAGSSIASFPPGSLLYYANSLLSLKDRVLHSVHLSMDLVPILVLYQTVAENRNTWWNPGRVVLFGDSSCADSVSILKVQRGSSTDCFWLVTALLEYLLKASVSDVLTPLLTSWEGASLSNLDGSKNALARSNSPAQSSKLKIHRLISGDGQAKSCTIPTHANMLPIRDPHLWEGLSTPVKDTKPGLEVTLPPTQTQINPEVPPYVGLLVVVIGCWLMLVGFICCKVMGRR